MCSCIKIYYMLNVSHPILTIFGVILKHEYGTFNMKFKSKHTDQQYIVFILNDIQIRFDNIYYKYLYVKQFSIFLYIEESMFVLY